MGSSRIVSRVAVAGLAVAAAVAVFAACGTSAVGIQTCRDIEAARCQAAPACTDGGFNLPYPLHEGTDVDSCIRFYNDQCLHGLVTSTLPGSGAVNACIAAIKSGNCAIVDYPENSPACLFLTPTPDSAVPIDAAEAGDAATDADDSGD